MFNSADRNTAFLSVLVGSAFDEDDYPTAAQLQTVIDKTRPVLNTSQATYDNGNYYNKIIEQTGQLTALKNQSFEPDIVQYYYFAEPEPIGLIVDENSPDP